MNPRQHAGTTQRKVERKSFEPLHIRLDISGNFIMKSFLCSWVYVKYLVGSLVCSAVPWVGVGSSKTSINRFKSCLQVFVLLGELHLTLCCCATLLSITALL